MSRPKPTLFEVHHSNYVKNGCTWYLNGYPRGRREQFWFKTETLAKKAANEKNAEITATGTQDQLPYALRIGALEGNRQLAPYGKTITDAVNFYLKQLKLTERSITVRALAKEYLEFQRVHKRSKEHQTDLRGRFARFCLTFGDRLAHELTPAEIEQWLFSLNVAPTTFNNYRNRISFLFGYGVRHNYLEKGTNPIDERIEHMPEPDEPVEIFTVPDMVTLLNHATPEILPMFVTGAFAGLRTSELLELEWGDVNFNTGHLDVRAGIAKSARSRFFKMESNLIEWLEPYAGCTGRVWKGTHDTYKNTRKAIRKAAGIRWVDNGLRHSFASYHLALYQNQNQLADLLGHVNSKLIFSNYRAVVKIPGEGTKYFSIRPKESDKIIPMDRQRIRIA